MTANTVWEGCEKKHYQRTPVSQFLEENFTQEKLSKVIYNHVVLSTSRTGEQRHPSCSARTQHQEELGLMEEMLDSGTGTGKAYDDLEHLGSNEVWKSSRNEGAISKGPRSQVEGVTVSQLQGNFRLKISELMNYNPVTKIHEPVLVYNKKVNKWRHLKILNHICKAPFAM